MRMLKTKIGPAKAEVPRKTLEAFSEMAASGVRRRTEDARLTGSHRMPRLPHAERIVRLHEGMGFPV